MKRPELLESGSRVDRTNSEKGHSSASKMSSLNDHGALKPLLPLVKPVLPKLDEKLKPQMPKMDDSIEQIKSLLPTMDGTGFKKVEDKLTPKIEGISIKNKQKTKKK